MGNINDKVPDFFITGLIPGIKKDKNNRQINNEDKTKLINKINALEEELLKANQKLKEKDIINEQLKLDLSKKDNNIKESNSNLTKLEAEMKKKDIELKRLIIDLNVKKEENKDNKLIEVKIVSSNKNIKINTSIKSFENDKFIIIEEKFYIEFEKYKEINNMFLVKKNKTEVKRYKTLKENNINDGDVEIQE